MRSVFKKNISLPIGWYPREMIHFYTFDTYKSLYHNVVVCVRIKKKKKTLFVLETDQLEY